jgi:hypothetical protein
MTQFLRSTRDQQGNCSPILATVHSYRILQLAVFVFRLANVLRFFFFSSDEETGYSRGGFGSQFHYRQLLIVFFAFCFQNLSPATQNTVSLNYDQCNSYLGLSCKLCHLLRH